MCLSFAASVQLRLLHREVRALSLFRSGGGGGDPHCALANRRWGLIAVYTGNMQIPGVQSFSWVAGKSACTVKEIFCTGQQQASSLHSGSLARSSATKPLHWVEGVARPSPWWLSPLKEESTTAKYPWYGLQRTSAMALIAPLPLTSKGRRQIMGTSWSLVLTTEWVISYPRHWHFTTEARPDDDMAQALMCPY